MQTVEPLNTFPIQQFIQQVKTAEAGRAKEVKLTMDQAKALAFTLGITMSRLHGDLEKLVTDIKPSSGDDVIQINLDGGSGF